MRTTGLFSVAGFLLLIAIIVVSYNIRKPRVLILHSYDAGYAWTRDVDAGIESGLKGKGGYFVRRHYMDTKRRPDPAFKNTAGKTARRIIDEWSPDIVIAVDDDAQQLVMRNYVGHRAFNIIFAGVNAEPDRYGYAGAENVTGILERKPLEAVKRLLHDISGRRSRPLKLIHIGDRSGSVLEDDAHIRGFDWSPATFVRSELVPDFDSWKRAVIAAQRDADVIITTNYRGLGIEDTGKMQAKPGEIVTWTEEHSAIPVIGTNGFYVEDGGGIAIATSAYEQGVISAGMARDVLDNGKKAGSIPIVATRQFAVYLRESRLRARQITLPPVYESFARSTDNYFK